jgi:hypothetical protein
MVWKRVFACVYIRIFKFNVIYPSYYTEDYINEVLDENNDEDLRKNQSDDWEGGLTFIAKSPSSKNFFVKIIKV